MNMTLSIKITKIHTRQLHTLENDNRISRDMNKEWNQTDNLLHYFIHCGYTQAIKLLTSATFNNHKNEELGGVLMTLSQFSWNRESISLMSGM
jgi:hypothetical protein